jgi:hypothetical protein
MIMRGLYIGKSLPSPPGGGIIRQCHLGGKFLRGGREKKGKREGTRRKDKRLRGY